MHKEKRLSIWRVLVENFFRRDQSPSVMQPSVPLILRVGSACVFDFEFCIDDVGFPATEERLRVVPA